jgi:molybdate transport system substrate-binding protein
MRAAALALALLCWGCGKSVFEVPAPGPELHVAAAANLATIFGSLATAEYQKTGVHLVPSFGSTATLTTQIESGAPFDIFLAADTEHPQSLTAKGLAESPREYARGKLVIWAPKRPDIGVLADLLRPDVKTVAVANPDLAPYGHAAIEALTNASLLQQVRPKIVFGQNISAALSYANSGNADVALTAYSLVAAQHPGAPLVPDNLYSPIVQSLCILSRTSQRRAADQCVEFLLGPEAGAIFMKNGYGVPLHTDRVLKGK